MLKEGTVLRVSIIISLFIGGSCQEVTQPLQLLINIGLILAILLLVLVLLESLGPIPPSGHLAAVVE